MNARLIAATRLQVEMAVPSRDLLYFETNDVASRDAFIDVPVPSLIWNRSYLIPKRPKFNPKTAGAKDEKGRRFTRDEVCKDVDKAILQFLCSEPGRDYRVEPGIGSDIILFKEAYDRETVGVGKKPKLVATQGLSSEHNRLLTADERALVLRGVYTAAGHTFDIRIRVHLRSNLFTISIVATPHEPGRFPVLRTRKDFDALTIAFWMNYSDHAQTFYPFRRGFFQRSMLGVFADSRGIIAASDVVAGGAVPVDPHVGWAESVMRRLAPLLSPHDAADLTATYMLDKRAFSVTTFGSADAARVKGRTPLTFVICIDSDVLRGQESSWARQMGHVMIRSHTITTMRLAALLDMKLLRKASDDLAKVDDVKARARELITAYDGAEVEGGPARDALDDLRQHLAKINNDFLAANAAGVGLTFRIESSQYYIEEFRKNVEALQLDKIEGYQSYSQTIDRNIGLIFEFIGRLGKRYDRLLAEMAIIEQTFSTVQTRHTGNLIAEIQRFGELILIGGLLPYYGIGIVSHVFGGPETHDEKTYLWQVLYAAIWMGFSFLAYFRYRVSVDKASTLRSRNARHRLAWRLFAIGLAVTATLCLAIKYWPLAEKHLVASEPTSKASVHPNDTSAAEDKAPNRQSPRPRKAE